MTDSEKHSSLTRFGINYGRKKILGRGPQFRERAGTVDTSLIINPIKNAIRKSHFGPSVLSSSLFQLLHSGYSKKLLKFS